MSEPAKEDEQPPTTGEGESPDPQPPATSGTNAETGEPQVVEDEAFVFSMGVDDFYDKQHCDKEIEDSKISRRNTKFYSVLGQSSARHYNIHFLEDDIIIFIVGNKYQTYNLTTQELTTYDGLDTDGVGSISVHPTRQYFAVAERGDYPNTYVYEWPSLKTYRIMRKGTERAYAHTEFAPSGTKLVTLGSFPDFNLTVWDWVNERVILKCKAFGQDVFKTSFSPFSDDILFTAGSGHMKFWKMALTFTGLKLQGEIAKYGVLELSDVYGYHELPDGKILSGTEYGTMILWEGNLVKAHMVLEREAKTPLHNGTVETILFENDHFISSGSDGYIKWWPLADIDQAEADELPEVAIAPVKEVCITDDQGRPANLVNMVRGSDFWLLSDARGNLWKLSTIDNTTTKVLEYHSGSIMDMAISDSYNLAVTCAEDGEVKVWDYCRKKFIFSKRFEGQANCIDLLRRSELNKGRVCGVGYENGVVRILQMTDSGLSLAHTFKAHDVGVKFCRYSPSQTVFVTASKAGELFFFDVNGHLELGKYDPICLVQTPCKSEINDLKWDAQSNKILICTAAGYVYEIEKPNPSNCNVSESYLVPDYPMRQYKIRMMEFQMKKNQKKDEEEEEKKRRMRLRGELPKEEEEEEEDWDPECIHRVCYINDDSGNFILGSQGQYAGYLYKCSFDADRPMKAYPMAANLTITQLAFSNFGDLLLIGLSNGETQILDFNQFDNKLILKQHDASRALTAAKLSFDERFVITCGADGLLILHTIDKYMVLQEAKYDPLAGVEGVDYMPTDQLADIRKKKLEAYFKENEPNLPEIDPSIDGLDETMFAVSLRGFSEKVDDITDPAVYSIQQSKLRTEEDHRLKLAEAKKEGVRAKISDLRTEFHKLGKLNGVEDKVIRISDEDFNIDPEYFELLEEANLAATEETSKEVAWGEAYHRARLNKLKKKFYDNLDFEKFAVKAIRTPSYVKTFRVPKMSEFLNRNIEQFKQMMEKELTSKEAMDFEDEEEEAGQGEANADAIAGLGKAKAGAVVGASAAPGANNKSDAEKKREERKIEREYRKKKIEKLLKKEHMHQGESAENQENIKNARATFGTFNLKMSHDYEVPENMQINSQKKRQQMVLLEGSIHKLKVDFNTKINELKLRKKQIIGHVANLHERLHQINGELGTPETLVLPTIDEKAEVPQKFFDISDKEIDEYRDVKKVREIEAAAAKKGGKKNKKKEEEAKAAADAAAAENAKGDQGGNAKTSDTRDQRLTNDNAYFCVMAERKNHKKMESDLDDEYRQIVKIELQYEKDQLKKEIDDMINQFDEDIHEMQKEKYRLESDLKNADLKLILLFEELIILKSMEERDMDLSQQLKECRDAKVEIMRSIGEIKKKLNVKQNEINSIKQQQETLYSKFHDHCNPQSSKYDQIRAYFERVVKKRKKPEKIEKEADDDDDDAEQPEEEEDEPEEEEDEDDDAGIAGLSQEEFKIDEIERLRDERMDLVVEKDKIQDYILILEQDRMRAEKRERAVTEQLTETEESIADFQKEKMAKLNQLDVQVVLKIKQIQNLIYDSDRVNYWCDFRQNQLQRRFREIEEEYEDPEEKQQKMEEEQRSALEKDDWRGFFLPAELTDSVLFTRTQLQQLLERKRELDIETNQLQVERNHDIGLKKQREKENKEQTKRRDEKRREYEEKQLLRFGNLIDLDSLEVSGPSPMVLELMGKYNSTEQQTIKRIEEADSEYARTQRELTGCVQKNTQLLNLIRHFHDKQSTLDAQLSDNKGSLFEQSDSADRVAKERERENMKRAIEDNAQRIREKQTEINLYKSKGGHIYTKVTANRKMSHLNDQ